LFSPGNKASVLAKSLLTEADALIFDLEDAVPETEKDKARTIVGSALSNTPSNANIFVRVNALSTPHALKDVTEIARHAPAGIMLPKVESASDIHTLDWLLSQIPRPNGEPVSIVPLIETAIGLSQVRSIAAASQSIACLAFGAGDYTLDLGIRWSRDEAELRHARSEIALASRAAHLHQPVDCVWIELNDHDGFAASAQRARYDGFQGKLCIHPQQVGVVNAVFAPTHDEVAKAKKIVDGFDAANGEPGAAVKIDGTMVDYPIVASARRLLADHAKAQSLRKNT
jgi:citrate lyase subunit beta / citryl-CoA lyase